jgi:adenine phosphoribosyltransferase
MQKTVHSRAMVDRHALAARILATLRDVPDFPSPGILFKDITPLLADAALFADVVQAMADPAAGVTHVVGVESRGFLFGAPLALALGVPFVPARKPGKLPWHAEQEAYTLEYRQDVLEMHRDAFAGHASPRALVVDDVLATGGTAAATCRLCERLGATVAGITVLLEIGALGGRSRVTHPVDALAAC